MVRFALVDANGDKIALSIKLFLSHTFNNFFNIFIC